MVEPPLSARGLPPSRTAYRPGSGQQPRGRPAGGGLTTPRRAPGEAQAPVGLEATPDSSDVVAFLEVLEKHRQDCEREGRYEEALVAKQRCQQLREHEESKRREELRAQQLAERLNIEEAHMREIQHFNETWDQKVAEFETHAANIEEGLGQRHKSDHAQYMQKVRAQTEPRLPPRSKEYLNLRKIQDTLAKQKKYAEAADTKAEADQLEAREHEVWKARREAKIRGLEEQFLQKQFLEMNGLRKRIESGREEQRQQRKGELDRLLQRFQNAKQQLETQQKIIQQRVERYPLVSSVLANTTSLSRPSSKAGVMS